MNATTTQAAALLEEAAAADLATLEAATKDARQRIAAAREARERLTVQSAADDRAAVQAKRDAAAPEAWRAVLSLLAAEEKLLDQADQLVIGLEAIDAERPRSQEARSLAGVGQLRVGLAIRDPFKHAAFIAAKRRANLARDRADALKGLSDALGGAEGR